MLKFHIHLSKELIEGATLAIIPGDPERVVQIAQQLTNPRFLAANREFTSWLGYLADKPVIVTSTGIGGPSTSIAVEELAELGVTTFIRIGTTGAIQEDIKIGDIIITTASVRLDGASQHFAPLCYPACGDFYCLAALYQAAQDLQISHIHMGITASSDTFYPGQERYDTHSGYVIRALQGSFKEWKALHVLNYEMESATLYTMCATLGLRAGMIAGVIVNRNSGEIPDPAGVQHIEDQVIKIVLQGCKKLLA